MSNGTVSGGSTGQEPGAASSPFGEPTFLEGVTPDTVASPYGRISCRESGVLRYTVSHTDMRDLRKVDMIADLQQNGYITCSLLVFNRRLTTPERVYLRNKISQLRDAGVVVLGSFI